MATIVVPTSNVRAYIERYNIRGIGLGRLTDTQNSSDTLEVITRSGNYGDTIDILVRANDENIATLIDVLDLHNPGEPSHEGREDEIATLAERMAFLLGV